MKKMFNKKGFTLIELLVVIAIIAALAVVVFAAINPADRLKSARDSRRVTDVNTILDAVQTAMIDGGGTLPAGMFTSLVSPQYVSATGALRETIIGSPQGTVYAAVPAGHTGGGCAATAGDRYTNISGAMPTYLAANPIDPTGGTNYTSTATGYTITISATGIVTVKNCNPEKATSITVTR